MAYGNWWLGEETRVAGHGLKELVMDFRDYPAARDRAEVGSLYPPRSPLRRLLAKPQFSLRAEN